MFILLLYREKEKEQNTAYVKGTNPSYRCLLYMHLNPRGFCSIDSMRFYKVCKYLKLIQYFTFNVRFSKGNVPKYVTLMHIHKGLHCNKCSISTFKQPKAFFLCMGESKASKKVCISKTIDNTALTMLSHLSASKSISSHMPWLSI